MHCELLHERRALFIPLAVVAINASISSAMDEASFRGKRERLHSHSRDSQLEYNELCFNKIKFPADMTHMPDDFLPLNARNYPISEDHYVYEVLSQSMCPSVTLPDDCEVTQDVEDMIKIVGGPPSHATKNDPTSGFWEEFCIVSDVQLLRRMKGHEPASTIMPLPDLWENFTIDEVAEAVHDEYPGYHQAKLLETFFQDGIKIDNDIIPKRSEAQFLRGPVLLSYLNQWALMKVGPINFAAKYFVGRARPEEVAWAIATNNIVRGDVPREDIIDNVREMNLATQESFTAYEEGCPMHPSWPAMHSAASSISMWLPVVADLTEEQLLQARLTDFAVAYGRLVAGVHYASDNDDGLNMGQEIIARELPKQLAELLGSSKKRVERKIEDLRFDWRELSAELGGTFKVAGVASAMFV